MLIISQIIIIKTISTFHRGQIIIHRRNTPPTVIKVTTASRVVGDLVEVVLLMEGLAMLIVEATPNIINIMFRSSKAVVVKRRVRNIKINTKAENTGMAETGNKTGKKVEANITIATAVATCLRKIMISKVNSR